MGGAFGQEIGRLMMSVQGNSMVAVSKERDRWERYKEDVSLFISEFSKDALFTYCPPRSHVGFADFSHPTQLKVRDPMKLGKLLKTCSVELDEWKDTASKH